MGASFKIIDIAHTLIKLSGKNAKDVGIVFTGLREGEKFFEELFYENEQVVPSSCDKIKRSKAPVINWHELERHLAGLRTAVARGDADEIRDRIKEIVPEYVYTSYFRIT